MVGKTDSVRTDIVFNVVLASQPAVSVQTHLLVAAVTRIRSCISLTAILLFDSCSSAQFQSQGPLLGISEQIETPDQTTSR